MKPDRLGLLGIVGLWLLAVVVFIATAARGIAAVRVGQVLSGFCIILAGTLLLNDWMGTSTAMAERSSARWRKRLDIAETRDPKINMRSSRVVAWWWIAFGALVVLLGVAGHS